MSEKKLEELRQQILAVFPKVAPSSKESLTTHRCRECDGVRDDFGGVRWWSAGQDVIEKNVDTVPLLSAEAFHYYLPAYLLRSLKTFDRDSPVLEYTIYSLSPTKTSADDPWYREKLNLFTPEQVSAVADFLECVLADEGLYDYYADAERGLRKFWHVVEGGAAS
jgi:hypothetical protein